MPAIESRLQTPKASLGKVLFFSALFALIFATQSQAQCTADPTCTPGSSANPAIGLFGSGIKNVTFGTVNFSPPGLATTYQNVACSQVANITVGSPVEIRVRTGSNVDENVRVWLDINSDGAFDPTTELVFSSNNARQHNGNIIVPASAVRDTVLRMRIASEVNTGVVPTPCGTPDLGQYVDIGVRAVENTSPPVAAFSSADTVSCTGLVNFRDNSIGAPGTWLWNFGDGNSSTQQNPAHQYQAFGTYTVSLIVGNANGFDTLTKVNYIRYSDSVARPAVCTPITATPCCNYGIRGVVLGDLNSTPEGVTTGYKDFACKYRARLIVGKQYNLSIATGPDLNQDTRVWIDYNNDGAFDNVAELVFASNNQRNPSGTLVVPINALQNTPLRMRVSSDFVGSLLAPCNNVTNGQVQDFTVIFRANTLPPVADFVISQASGCDSVIRLTSFADNRVDSIRWHLGDGTVITTTEDTLRYTYNDFGVYDVKMVVFNPFGADSLTKFAGVVYSRPTLEPSCRPATTQYCCGIGVQNFTFGTINNTTQDGRDGYQDYTCSNITTLAIGTTQQLSVRTSNANPENVRVWLDANNDGIFQDTELIFTSNNRVGTHTGTFTVPNTAVQDVPLRVRVYSDASAPQSPTPGPCVSPRFGQIEDYAAIVIPNREPPTAGFFVANRRTCTPLVLFRDSSMNAPTEWLWDFGDGTTDTRPNPDHTYTQAGTYTIKLFVRNANGEDSLIRPNYLTILEGNGLVAATCRPTTQNACCGIAPVSVAVNGNLISLGNWVQRTYTDIACESRFEAFSTGPSTISVATGPNNPENLRVWIDWNSDGTFDPVTELVLSSNNSRTHTGTFTPPTTAPVGTLLRMRVTSDWFQNNNIQPCGNAQFGQTFDLSIMLKAITTPPVAGFRLQTSSCTGLVAFTDTSVAGVSQWLWNFGDGNTSTERNPIHVYQTTGTFDVSLKVTNPAGVDSITIPNAVTINQFFGPRPACIVSTNTPQTGSAIGIRRVQFQNIDNQSGTAVQEGYQDFTCTDTTTVMAANRYQIRIQVGSQNQNEFLKGWVDWNDDGVLAENETIFNGASQRGVYQNNNILIPAGAVRNKFLRMRIANDFGLARITTACNNLTFGQAEDYGIRVVADPASLPLAIANDAISVFPNPSADGRFKVEFLGITENNATVEVRNMLGQLVHTQTLNQVVNGSTAELNLSHLVKGNYILSLNAGSQRAIKRIAIQ